MQKLTQGQGLDQRPEAKAAHMNILIVEPNNDLGHLWQSHLERLGARVLLLDKITEAQERLNEQQFDVVVLDLLQAQDGCFELADVIAYRWPLTRIIFVTGSTFFSDGSIFGYVPNACAMVPRSGPPEDLAAVVEHYATHPA